MQAAAGHHDSQHTQTPRGEIFLPMLGLGIVLMGKSALVSRDSLSWCPGGRVQRRGSSIRAVVRLSPTRFGGGGRRALDASGACQ